MPKLTEAYASKMTVPLGKREAWAVDGDHRDTIPGLMFRKLADSEPQPGKKPPRPRAVSAYLDVWVGGKEVRGSLGKVLPGSMHKIRRDAVKARQAAEDGIDWFEQRREANKPLAAEPQPETFGASLEGYLEARRNGIGYRGPMSPRSLEEVTRHLRVHCTPLHDMPLRSISRGDISDLLDGLQRKFVKQSKDGRITRDHVLASVSTYLMWCLDRQKIEAHPAVGIRRIGESENARPLSEGELAEVWQATAAGCEASRYCNIVRLGILTALRRENLGNLEWAWVDLDARELRIPAAKMKNRLDFTLPLSAQAVELLQSIPQEGRYVFNQFKAWGAAKRRLDKRINAARKKPIEPWVLHGLRATFSTIMRERDLATHEIIEECLSHKSPARQGIAADYNKAQYVRQKREAMQAWGALVAELTD